MRFQHGRRFAFRLSKALGCPHPDYLLELLTAEQLAEWRAYDLLEPIGTERIEYGFAMLCAVIMNIALSVFGKKDAKQFSPLDFMPSWDGSAYKEREETKKQSVEEMKRILEMIAAGQPKKKGGGK